MYFSARLIHVHLAIFAKFYIVQQSGSVKLLLWDFPEHCTGHTHLKYECPIEIYGFYGSIAKSSSVLPAGKLIPLPCHHSEKKKKVEKSDEHTHTHTCTSSCAVHCANSKVIAINLKSSHQIAKMVAVHSSVRCFEHCHLR